MPATRGQTDLLITLATGRSCLAKESVHMQFSKTSRAQNAGQSAGQNAGQQLCIVKHPKRGHSRGAEQVQGRVGTLHHCTTRREAMAIWRPSRVPKPDTQVGHSTCADCTVVPRSCVSPCALSKVPGQSCWTGSCTLAFQPRPWATLEGSGGL